MSERILPRLKYQFEYCSLLDALDKVYGSTSSNHSNSLDLFPGVGILLEERYEGEDPPSPEDAIDCLLDAAINRFGYSACDVFAAIFNYTEMTKRHEKAFNLDYTELLKTISALSKNRTANRTISHLILAICPVDQSTLTSVVWNVDFKSDWVARNVFRELGDAKDNEIRRQISYFRNIPEARGLAGRLLEPLAHRYIANATGGIWSLTKMNSNGADPPHFTLVQDTLVPERFIKVKRKIVKFQSTADLSTCMENNSYCLPADPNFPLFDAFTVELDYAEESAILWALQVTTSRKHGSSAVGYRKIREIIAILKDKLRKDPPRKKSKRADGQTNPTPRVEVRYLLVVPKDELQSQNPWQWKFPKGWSQNRKKNDHVGNVYCLEVPLAVCSTIIKNVSNFEHYFQIQ